MILTHWKTHEVLENVRDIEEKIVWLGGKVTIKVNADLVSHATGIFSSFLTNKTPMYIKSIEMKRRWERMYDVCDVSGPASEVHVRCLALYTYIILIWIIPSFGNQEMWVRKHARNNGKGRN